MEFEIGSEFWDIPLSKKENKLFNNVSWFISGRAAFRAILRHIKENLKRFVVGLPSYLCESMIEPLLEEKIEFKFYQVKYSNGRLLFDFESIIDCDAVVVIDFFGYKSELDNENLPGKIIIRDLTHSVFSSEYDDADYYFCSLRKWAGFHCGGFAFTKNGKLDEPLLMNDNYISLRQNAMHLKEEYINCTIEKKEHLILYRKAEELLSGCELFGSDNYDKECARHLDIDFLKIKRRNNAQFLISKLNDMCLFKKLSKYDCPLFVPIVCDRRDELREYLIKNGVYCPVHWPKPFSEKTDSDFLYNHELSLVCDQRYSKGDMKKIVSLIKEFMGSEQNA